MGGHTVNNWSDLDYDTANLAAGIDNAIDAGQYVTLLPAANNNRIVAFNLVDNDPTFNWEMRVENGDITNTMNILLIGGATFQTPPQIIMPPGKTTITLPPGYAQLLTYRAVLGGWFPQFPGTLA